MSKTNSVEVFVSYSHQDEEWRVKLSTHLTLLETQGFITTWHDRKIEGGKEWKNEIDEHIDTCEIILLLISPDFLASKYCYAIEMKRAMERHEAGDARVIPVIVRPSDWDETPISKLQAFPSNGVAISKWTDEDDAFLDITQNLRTIIKKIEPKEKEGAYLAAGSDGLDNLVLKEGKRLLSIGVDVGTTKIAAALVEIERGKPPKLNKDNIVRKDHDEKKSPEGVLEKIKDVIDEVIRKEGITKNEIDAIGLGLPGQVRRTDGQLHFAPGLQIENHNFCVQLQRQYNVPVHADNDVNCSTFAELVAGDGVIYDDFVCIFVGTGIGAGIVINKQIIRGHNFSAGEVGHMKIDFRPDARECTCGEKGCYEEYASARAIVRLARIRMFDVIERKLDSKLKDLDPRTIEPKDIVALMKEGDEEAKELSREIANHLSIGLANIANLLNPQTIILGGGVIEGFYDFPEFEKTINKKFKDYAIPACATVSLVKTSFKSASNCSPAPIIGAAILPFERAYAN
jgi:glucokinase-like ROK family protein